VRSGSAPYLNFSFQLFVSRPSQRLHIHPTLFSCPVIMRQTMLACLVFGAHSALSIPVQSDLSKGIINFFTRPRSSTGLARRQNHGSSLKDENDHDYLANIKLGGVDLQVFLDTGR
jgi:hypothetical protein